MQTDPESFAFATLALGPKYSFFAAQLAADLFRDLPEHQLIVLTDSPSVFRGLPNVVLVRHRQRSIFRCYHDKRFAFEEGLGRANNCAYIDSDSRLLPGRISYHALDCPSGLWARGVTNLESKYEREILAEALARRIGRRKFTSATRRYHLISELASTLGVTLSRVQFVPESVILASNRDGKAADWLRYWDQAARFLELRGYSWGEGDAIGIAAECAGLQVGSLPAVEDWLFNDAYFRDKAAISEHQRATIDRLLTERVSANHAFALACDAASPIRLYKQLSNTLGMARRLAFTLFTRRAIPHNRGRQGAN